jgi:hypothetical protein
MRRMNVGLRTTCIVPQGSVVPVALPPVTVVVVLAAIVVMLVSPVLVVLVVAEGPAMPVVAVLVAIHVEGLGRRVGHG